MLLTLCVQLEPPRGLIMTMGSLYGTSPPTTPHNTDHSMKSRNHQVVLSILCSLVCFRYLTQGISPSICKISGLCKACSALPGYKNSYQLRFVDCSGHLLEDCLKIHPGDTRKWAQFPPIWLLSFTSPDFPVFKLTHDISETGINQIPLWSWMLKPSLKWTLAVHDFARKSIRNSLKYPFWFGTTKFKLIFALNTFISPLSHCLVNFSNCFSLSFGSPFC